MFHLVCKLSSFLFESCKYLVMAVIYLRKCTLEFSLNWSNNVKISKIYPLIHVIMGSSGLRRAHKNWPTECGLNWAADGRWSCYTYQVHMITRNGILAIFDSVFSQNLRINPHICICTCSMQLIQYYKLLNTVVYSQIINLRDSLSFFFVIFKFYSAI